MVAFHVSHGERAFLLVAVASSSAIREANRYPMSRKILLEP